MSGAPDRPSVGAEGPSASLSRDDVAHVARLARLALSDEELDLFTGQLVSVLEHAADVAALDLSDVAPLAHPLPLLNVLRADEPRPCLPRDEVLAQAPAVEDRRFKVPRIVGEAP
jgi:aspartyl-tRNA(Asn)/glutamyl-tRNA(Gln) amidotransferase subunit C